MTGSQNNPTRRKNSIGRRRFLKGVAGLGGGVWSASVGYRALGGAQTGKTSTPHAEKIGWRVGCQQYTFRRFSLYEALEMMDSLGIRYLEACYYIRVAKERPELRAYEKLPAELREELRAKLAQHGIQMSVYRANLDGTHTEEECRRAFEFAQQMGAGTIMSEPDVEMFDLLERLCQRFQISLAVHNHPKSPKSQYWTPDNVLKVCQGRTRWIGACADTGHWARSGLDPVECLKKLEGRILSVHVKDIEQFGNPKSRDVPLGTGQGNFEAALKELYRQRFRGPLLIEYEHDSPKLLEDLAACTAFIDRTAKSLAGQ